MQGFNWMAAAALWLGSAAQAAESTLPACQTHERCTPPGPCACVCPARSAGWVYYYFDMAVQPDHIYRCNFSGLGLWAVPEGATYPAGASDTWEACCRFNPATVRLDTHGMLKPADNMVIKFGRTPSDYPFKATVQCTIDE